MGILIFVFGIAPWLLPAVLISVLVKSRQPDGITTTIFPTMLLSVPLTVIFSFILFQCAGLLEQWGLIVPKGSEALGYFAKLLFVVIFISSIFATYFAAKLVKQPTNTQ